MTKPRTEESETRLEFRILGPLEVSGDDGANIQVASAAQRRLLAVLVVRSGSVTSSDQLAELLDVSTSGLRTGISRVRSLLGETVIATTATGYSLAQGEIDAVRFEALLAKSRGTEPPEALEILDQALGLWRGTALAGFADEEWAQPEAVRLSELRAGAVEDRASALLTLGRRSEAIASLERHIADFRFRDRPRGLLMRALAEEGRETEALRVYQDYRAFLIAETGLEPGDGLRTIEKDIASGRSGSSSAEAAGTPRHEIRFTSSADGATIAYWDVGSGPPVIIVHNVTLSHAELDWAVPSLASFYSGLTRQHRVIRLDPRRCGLSDQRPQLAMTAAAVGDDIAAVADACGIDEFSLLGVSAMGVAVIEYAVRFPRRVSHMILCDADLRVATSRHGDYVRGLVALTKIQGRELASSLYIKVAPKNEVEAMSALLAASPPELELLGDAVLKWDAEGSVERVAAPTLIILSRDSILSSLDEARRMAASIPNAQLLVVEGEFAPYFADQQVELEAIHDFLS